MSAQDTNTGSWSFNDKLPASMRLPHQVYQTSYLNSIPQITSFSSTMTTKKRKRKPRLFAKDIEILLFAMGDRPALTDGTIAALEDILVEYLVGLCHSFQSYAHTQGRTRVKMNDVVFALRNDPLKLARLDYIVEQSDRIQRAKKMFEAKTGNFDENGGPGANSKRLGFQESDDDLEDEDSDNDGRTVETKKKKRKVVVTGVSKGRIFE